MKIWRHYTMIIVFVTMMGALVYRAGYLAFLEREFLQDQGQLRTDRVEKIHTNRAVILDRNGEPLAVSTPVISIWFDPERDKISMDRLTELAEITGVSENLLNSRIENGENKRFVYLARRISPGKAKAVENMQIGVRYETEYRRFYPAGAFAAHVVGMTGIDDGGQEGIELAMDENLRGSPGSKRVQRDRLGNVIRDLDFYVAPEFGKDVRLSIDLRLQFQAYRELLSAVKYHQAISGSLVVLDVDSGDVLALVNEPSYNPNDFRDRNFSSMRNRVITDVYEPGSTVKPFAVLAALETEKFSRDSEIDTAPGYFMVGRKLIKDPINRGRLSFSEIIAKSSQVGISKIALSIGERDVYDVLSRSGLNELPGTGLPGETTGLLSDRDLDKSVVRASLAYGYGVTASPLQLAQSYLTIATGGIRRQLKLIDGLPTEKDRRVFDEGFTRSIMEMMHGVVTEEGTAPKARISGFNVAGKTGTSRKAMAGGYDENRHVALFAGFAPASEPKVVVVVVINEPKGEAVGGGQVAAPVFARVVARSLRLIGVMPTEPQKGMTREQLVEASDAV